MSKRTLSWILSIPWLTSCLVGCRDPDERTTPRVTPPRIAVEKSSEKRFERSKQLLVVLGESWNSPRAELHRFERTAHGAKFERSAPPKPAMVGRSGFGVGLGLLAIPLGEAPRKVEGDGRAPAGLFRLEKAFGAAQEAETAFPYLRMSERDICVDDASDPNYGRLMALGSPAPKSFELMRRADALYELGVTIGHNPSREPGKGSCIFLHVWRAPDRATSGCTALARDEVFSIVRFLDKAKEPLLLQIPKTELAGAKPYLEELGLAFDLEGGQRK